MDADVDPVDWHGFHPGMRSDNEGEGAMVDALINAGAHKDVSKLDAATLTGKKNGRTFMELYGRGSVVADANKRRRNFDVRGIAAMNLRTYREDGSPWDVNCHEDRRPARELIQEQHPDWIVRSPLCTAFSI